MVKQFTQQNHGELRMIQWLLMSGKLENRLCGHFPLKKKLNWLFLLPVGPCGTKIPVRALRKPWNKKNRRALITIWNCNFRCLSCLREFLAQKRANTWATGCKFERAPKRAAFGCRCLKWGRIDNAVFRLNLEGSSSETLLHFSVTLVVGRNICRRFVCSF